MKSNRAIVSRQESFADWYTSIVERAELVHYSPIKGMMTFLPRGWAVWEQIQSRLNAAFSRLGAKNVAMPSLFPKSDLQLEKSHVEGFAPEVFLISQMGGQDLPDPYVLRPTSEVAVCRLWSEILRTYTQLPLLFNQWCSVFRVEKNTRPFLRNSEFHWQEAHGAYASEADCVKAVRAFHDVYADLIENVLMIPTLRGEKTENERFAGGLQTLTLEAIMPDGQCLQSATSHHLGQNFAKAFNVRFQGGDNAYAHPYTMSAGISTRIIGALIMTHGDDAGLVLPFSVAPEQIALIPLLADKDERVAKAAARLKADLGAKWRVWDKVPGGSLGSRLASAEIAGAPLCVIVGPEDAAAGTATVKWRTRREKAKVPLSELDAYVQREAPLFDKALFDAASARAQTQVGPAKTLDEVVAAAAANKVALAPWAGSAQDEVELKKRTGLTARCIKGDPAPAGARCFFTGRTASRLAYFGRAY